MVPLRHIQNWRPSGARMVPNQVVTIWHVRRQSQGCQDGTFHYHTYNVNNCHYLAFNARCVILASRGIYCPLRCIGTTWYLMCCHNFFYCPHLALRRLTLCTFVNGSTVVFVEQFLAMIKRIIEWILILLNTCSIFLNFYMFLIKCRYKGCPKMT